MTEHDDFDRRVRELLEMAQADAPDADFADTRRRTRSRGMPARVALVAAAVALVVVGVAVLGRRASDTTLPTDGSGVTSDVTASTPTSSVLPSTTAFDPLACGRSLAVPYEETGTIHTVVPSSLPLEVSISVPDGGACTGGSTRVSITLTNPTDLPVDVEPTAVVVSSGMDKWVVGQLGSETLQPGATVTHAIPVAVPPIPPGAYSVFLYGFAASAPFDVSGPRVCVVTDLVSEVVAEGGDGVDQYQRARVTNRGTEPCVLLRPTSAMGLRFGGTAGAVTLQPGAGAFGAIAPTLADHVLDPGASATLVLSTSQRCDGEREVYDMIDVRLGVGNDPDGARSVSVGRDVDVTCGLWLSPWLEP